MDSDKLRSEPEQVKVCCRCREEKPASRDFFSPLSKSQDGLHSWCKPCCAEDRRMRRSADPESARAYDRARYARDAEVIRERNRANWAANADKYAAAQKKRYAAKKDQYNAARRAKTASDAALRQARSIKNKEWREQNADAVNASRREKWRNASPTQRLRTYVGASIAHSLRGGSKGGKSWQDIVGYTAVQLAAHLEKQFTKGMTWANYGDWHVDHIIPASSFKYADATDPELRACWALSNLRPLWAGDNIRKRDTRQHLL